LGYGFDCTVTLEACQRRVEILAKRELGALASMFYADTFPTSSPYFLSHLYKSLDTLRGKHYPGINLAQAPIKAGLRDPGCFRGRIDARRD